MFKFNLLLTLIFVLLINTGCEKEEDDSPEGGQETVCLSDCGGEEAEEVQAGEEAEEAEEVQAGEEAEEAEEVQAGEEASECDSEECSEEAGASDEQQESDMGA